jgi:hypothetical protein
MLIGYDRVSTKDRSLDLQLDALRKAECEAVFTEVASSAKTACPVLDEVLSRLRVGDLLVSSNAISSVNAFRPVSKPLVFAAGKEGGLAGFLSKRGFRQHTKIHSTQ